MTKCIPITNFCPNYQCKTSNALEKFSQICISVLDKLAPQKKEYIDNMLFINKTLTQVHRKKSHFTAQRMKFSIKDFFSKCDQIRWSDRSVREMERFGIIKEYLEHFFIWRPFQSI